MIQFFDDNKKTAWCLHPKTKMLKVRPCWIMPGSADSCCATVWSRSTRPQGAQWWENLKEFSEDDQTANRRNLKPTMFWLEFISDCRFNFSFKRSHSRPCSISHADACRTHINNQLEWDVVPHLVSLWNGRQQITGVVLLIKYKEIMNKLINLPQKYKSTQHPWSSAMRLPPQSCEQRFSQGYAKFSCEPRTICNGAAKF